MEWKREGGRERKTTFILLTSEGFKREGIGNKSQLIERKKERERERERKREGGGGLER